MTKSRRQSHVVLALLAGAVLYWVLHLSAGGRGPVDWTVIGLVSLAVTWNVLQLSRRLSVQGAAAVWHVLRTLLFWLVGLLGILTPWAWRQLGGVNRQQLAYDGGLALPPAGQRR